MFKINAIGSDPELVLLDKTSKQPVSAIGLDYHSSEVNLYADNVLAEFSHPPFNPADFAAGISSTVDTVRSVVSTFKNGCTFELGQCQAEFTIEDVSTPEAQKIGCDPFYNAYNLGVPAVPKPYTDNNRYAGGHIHLAYDVAKLPPQLLVQLLDKELLPLDPNHKRTARSDFYGAEGSFRYKPYGLEYRPTSNFWLKNPELVTDVLKSIQNYTNKKYYGA